MTLWTSDAIAAATGGKATAGFEATGVSIDTRTLKPGEVYLALKGDSLDGHDYVGAAFKAGASGAIVREGFATSGGPLIAVADTMKALESLGQAGRARAKAKIIAVTGSAGKTGTKEMLATVLSAAGKTHASKKSFNNHWGVPLSLANLPPDAAFGVFEMGMNHAGEIEKLAAQVKPHIAIITTIEPVHIENFANIEGIADAKAEIFSGMAANGIAILNLDNPRFARLKAQAEKYGIKKIVSFGEDEEAEAQLLDCILHADSSKVTANILGEQVRYRLNTPGHHIIMNSLAVLAAAKLAGCAMTLAAEALKNAQTVEGRGNRVEIVLEAGAAPLTLIDESYNANPAAMAAAFSVLEMVEPKPGGRRIAVLGDMLELGRDGPQMHAGLANPLLKAKTDLVFCCGPLMDALYQLLPEDWRGGYAKNSQELSPLVTAAVKPGDVVLVKGSWGSKMSYVVQALQLLHANTPKEKRNAL